MSESPAPPERAQGTEAPDSSSREDEAEAPAVDAAWLETELIARGLDPTEEPC